MEALQRLQSVNAVLQLIHAHDFSDTGEDIESDRFLAEFLLFLDQACTDVEDMDRRCHMLADQLTKIPRSLLHEIAEQKNSSVGLHPVCQIKVQHEENLKEDSVLHQRKSAFKDSFKREVKAEDSERLTTDRMLQLSCSNSCPMVGLKAMERASSTIEDFCRSYFMFHDLDIREPSVLFKHLAVISFVEAFIYQLDEQNEDQLDSNIALGNNNPEATVLESQLPFGEKLQSSLGEDPFCGLRDTLTRKGLLTERIQQQLLDGVQYWRLEHILCMSMLTHQKMAVEDVMQAIRLKSFDYRVLNLLLYRMRNVSVNEAHMEFLAVSELLVEISDDLFDYEEDVLANSFNVLRMFVRIYGPVKGPPKLAKLISEEEIRYQQLLGALEPAIAKQFQRRCAEASREGGGNTGHVFGSWTFPKLIINEEEYRSEMQASSSTSVLR